MRRALAITCLLIGACRRSTPYESSTPAERSGFKRVALPLNSGTRFTISQGAFGKNTHHDPGHQYTWDFDVPFGTPVLAVEGGTVLQVWEPNLGGGCDPKFNEGPHNVKVKHADGTVAQYVHVDSRVHVGRGVAKGDIIAVTSLNGFLCTPQLDFGIYLDEQHLYGSGQMTSIPLLFDGLPDNGMAHEGYSGTVP
jgi:murein DD-endopeptidase MepM/ murein hydrolase activator NlpD